MAGRLLLVVFMYPFSEMNAQELLPPQLTVNPPVITETDSVTLNCQTPSSVSVTKCYFHFVRGGTGKSFPCLQTLTGTELLKMSSQSSPAEVKVTCFYLKGHPSPDSDMSSIIIRTSLPPKLTVNPPVINETDSVTLNCEAPSSASVPLCSFFTSSGGTVRVLSCLQTLTGSELLKISQQRSPAEVQVTCFYTVKLGAKSYPSPHSDTSSITIHNNRFHKIQTQAQPKLIVNSPVITEMETVTLDCQTPSSVPVHHCYFYTVGRQNAKGFSCLQKLTGTELLRMSQQRSPAEVQVKCYYTVKLGDVDAPSPHSDTSSITVQSQKPQMVLQHFDGEQVLFTCSLPGSANKDTRCNLYFGEASHPVTTTTVWKKRISTNQRFCQFTVTIDDLLRHLHFLQSSDASCDYSLGSEPNSLSPRSDRSSLNDVVKRESSMTSTDSAFNKNKDFTDSRSTASTFGITGKPVSGIVQSSTTQTKPASTTTTGLTVSRLLASTPVSPIKQASDQTVGSSNTGSFISTSLTPVTPTSDQTLLEPNNSAHPATPLTVSRPVTPIQQTSEKITLMIGGGVTVGVLLLGLALLLTQSRNGVSKRPNGLQVDYDETYSIVTYCTDATLRDNSCT